MVSNKGKTNKKNNKALFPIIVLLFLVLTISIGYAMLSSNLSINGLTKIKGQKWDVHFEDVGNITKVGEASDSGYNEYPPKIVEFETTPSDLTDDKSITFSISVKAPGDKYSFKTKVVNKGTTKARAKLTVTPIPSPASNYISWSVNGIDTVDGEIIEPGEEKELTISINYNSNLTEYPESDIDVTLSAVVNAEQA